MAKSTFYFSDGPYLQALQGLHQGLSAPESLIKLIGEVGTGKSALCEKLMLFMQHKGYRVVYFNRAIESPDMLRALLARELNLPNSTNFARMLEDIPLSDEGKPLILIFDDAHKLTDTTLLEIYRLIQIQSGAERKVNTVLCGEPLLEQKLARRSELTALRQQITHRISLQPMSAAETPSFVISYLSKMGMPGLLVEPAAMAWVYKFCQGLPGPAAQLAGLMVASRQGETELTSITRAELVQAAQQAQANGKPVLMRKVPAGDSGRWGILGPVMAVVIVASVGLLYQQLASDSATHAPGTVSAPQSDSPFVAVTESVQATPTPITVPALELPLEATPEPRQPDPGQPPATLVAGSPEPETAAPESEVSDSNLVLVTAAERGVSQAEIVEPEFTEVLSDTDAAAAQPTPPAAVEDPRVVAEAGVTVSVSEPVALAEPTPVEVAQVEPEPTPEPVPVTAEQVESVTPLDPRASVQAWVDAWQAQDLTAYFASYHANFEPRYHDSRRRWQQDRERVIGNARSIRLTVSDYVVIASEEGTLEVQFWLSYQSPTYADNTLKKLVLREENGRWLILEEVNLQVRS